MNISVVGLGKIGSCILATLASKGFNVIGVDINKDVVKKINSGEAPYFEPGLGALLKKYEKNIFATTNHQQIVDTDVTIIMVQTPSLLDGSFSTEYVEKAVLEVGRVIPDSKEYHNIIITSTILPGMIENKIKPLLEQCTLRNVGENIGLCYVPEFIAIGSIIENILHPDFVVIGESDKKAGDMAENLYRQLLGKQITDSMGNSVPGFIECNPPIHRMSIINAELAKIALNVYITMKISFANTIAEICENMPTGNAEDVLNAIGSDARIGKKFLKPGLSYGGTCFPRDNKAFKFIADKYKSQDFLSQMAEVVNIQQINRMVTIILQALSNAGTNKLSVLGITYKPDTNLTIESASLKIIRKLSEEGIDIDVYDPAIKHGFDEGLPVLSGVMFCDSAKQCVADRSVVFIATPWNEFKQLTRDFFIKYMKDKPTIIDGWGIQRHLRNEPDVNYQQIGVNRI